MVPRIRGILVFDNRESSILVNVHVGEHVSSMHESSYDYDLLEFNL